MLNLLILSLGGRQRFLSHMGGMWAKSLFLCVCVWRGGDDRHTHNEDVIKPSLAPLPKDARQPHPAQTHMHSHTPVSTSRQAQIINTIAVPPQ